MISNSFRMFVALVLTSGVLFVAPLLAQATVINGHSYVSIANWARANGYAMSSLKRGDEVVLNNKASRLVFDVDSRTAEINGVNVALSFPFANVKGTHMISLLDIETAVSPLVFPQKISPQKITTICLDPGHGGKDTGNRVGDGHWAHNEKTYTLALALELREQLKRAGFRVILTRTRDTFVDLPVRPDIANRHGADLFVSLHFNATVAGKDQVSGPETYCITPVGASSTNARGEGANYGKTTANHYEDESLLLAYQVQKSLVQNLGAEDRSVRRARFAVLRDAKMPAILIEGGYMTNPTEGKKIYSSEYRRQMAEAIVKGILSFQKLTTHEAAPARATTSHATSRSSSSNRHNEHRH